MKIGKDGGEEPGAGSEDQGQGQGRDQKKDHPDRQRSLADGAWQVFLAGRPLRGLVHQTKLGPDGKPAFIALGTGLEASRPGR